jgi:secondary thiamine-phosphate synthase enzyme
VLHREQLHLVTRGRGFVDITAEVRRVLAGSGIRDGLCTVFVHHTSASLILCENADPDVRRDLEAWFSRAVPDGDSLFSHSAEGPDDMPAHLRSVLTQTSVGLPVAEGRLDLGTWQGLYLWEHRSHGHRRRVSVTLVGA